MTSGRNRRRKTHEEGACGVRGHGKEERRRGEESKN